MRRIALPVILDSTTVQHMPSPSYPLPSAPASVLTSDSRISRFDPLDRILPPAQASSQIARRAGESIEAYLAFLLDRRTAVQGAEMHRRFSKLIKDPGT